MRFYGGSIGKLDGWSAHAELEQGIKAVLVSCERLRARAQKDLQLVYEAAQLCTVLLQDVLGATYNRAQEIIMLPRDSAQPSMPAGLVQAIFEVRGHSCRLDSLIHVPDHVLLSTG
jgi:hypothetical protein